ncbi:MAG: hypothetical protein ACFFDN_08050 [Candidatus Hodarchaeota archaeon]
MKKNVLSSIVIISLILGAIGLTFGIYGTLNQNISIIPFPISSSKQRVYTLKKKMENVWILLKKYPPMI